ncbi:amidohydrolase family protein [Arenicella xantha]|uniref:Aminocarboxymuconate-semialdehyde decarboxylase n=1 Tax=Arenicella xantha TaxID=644221 RepID=A0A395JEW9_9GAMM|nr:amidohydrolase family protein [Arenicella xantha]RBP47190.1 aminocarboxymuconate-semialdehyde decarboxylase [Arenicella xantha]
MNDNTIHDCGTADCTHHQFAPRGEHLVIDIHSHMNVAPAEALIRDAIPDLPRGLPFTSPSSGKVNAKMFAKIGARLNGVKERLEDMDQQGVDVQAISPNPGQYYYFVQEELGRDAARLINNNIAEAVASHPDRLVGMGTVPLQNVEMAIAEMKRCVKDCGMRGIEIGTNVNGAELADPKFLPFFKAAQELDVLLFMHPLGFTQGERLTEHYLNNIIGNPLESTIALSHLIFSGLLDAVPDLKLCVAHGGGYLSGYWGRMDHAYRAREDCRENISKLPSSYLRNIWFDTLVFDPQELDNLVRTQGADKLCLGTDYPFDMGESDPLGLHQELHDDVKPRIVGINAAKLLGLNVVTQKL